MIGFTRDCSSQHGPPAGPTPIHRPGPAAGALALALLVALSGVLAAAPAAAQGEAGHVRRAKAIYVRSGPGTDTDAVGILLQWDPVQILGETREGGTTWLEIESPVDGGVRGYLSAYFVGRGDAPGEALGSREIDYGPKETPTLQRGPFQYVGVAACRECHEDVTGDHPRPAVAVWEQHFHSNAFRSLAADYTAVIARRLRGVEDPTTDWRCVKCHQTAFGADPAQIGPGYDPAEGVTCEACHGPGSGYAQEDHGPDDAGRYALGFQKLTNLEEREALCTQCHNEASPTYKPFDVAEFSERIRHWGPWDGPPAPQIARPAPRPSPPPPEAAKPPPPRAAPPSPAPPRPRAEAPKPATKPPPPSARPTPKAPPAPPVVPASGPNFEDEFDDEDLDFDLVFNEDGDKGRVVFGHLRHATERRYKLEFGCNTCHHKGTEATGPRACTESDCHVVGNEAEPNPRGGKTIQYSHLRTANGVDGGVASCTGCHRRASRELGFDGAPDSCNECHKRD